MPDICAQLGKAKMGHGGKKGVIMKTVKFGKDPKKEGTAVFT